MADRLALLGGKRLVDTSLKVGWPIVTDSDKRAVMRVLTDGPLWALSTDDGLVAPEMSALEREFADYCGVTHGLACNGGTAAIHMALAAAGIGPGDEVITSAFSFLATPVAVLHQSAVPIFADIDPRTFNIDPADVERRITPRTKAIIPVHVHGVCADMDAITAAARRHGLVVIEDACQAPGARYKGKRAGSLSEMAAFSLNGTKNFPVGEGGLFVTSDETYRARANMVFNTQIERAHCRPWGLEGGLEGTGNSVGLRRDGVWKTDFPNAKVFTTALRPGDAFRVRSGGGGSYGTPLARPPEDVAGDVKQGYVSVAAAAELYGVVVDPETFEVDAAATERLRKARRAA